MAQEFASRFVKERALFAKHRTRDPAEKDGWTAVRERWIEPIADEGKRFKGKVAVLIGPKCFSSNETFLLMLRHGAKATLVGEKSFGSSGNPQSFDLGNGVVMMIPSWQAMDPNGEIFEGKGIEPDVAAKFVAGEGKDAILEAALKSIRP
jgi:C-terminal processing protease CtpA/Prc